MVTAAGQRAYLYQFTHVPPGPHAAEWGAYHASEIAYVFGTLRNPAATYTRDDRELSNAMSSYWVNFATSGDPNAKMVLVRWQPYTEANEPYLQLGWPMEQRQHLLKAQLDFLEQAQQRRRATQ
jgi:para-nitrobenzyl esterase